MKRITDAHKIEALQAGADALQEDVEHMEERILQPRGEKKRSRYDSSQGGPDLSPDLRMKFQAKHDLLVVCRELMLNAIEKLKKE